MSHLIASTAPQGLVATFYSDYLEDSDIPVMGFNSDGEALLTAGSRLVTVDEWIKYQCSEATSENGCCPIPDQEVMLGQIRLAAEVTVVPAEPGTIARGYGGEVEQVVAWQIRYGIAKPVVARSGFFGQSNDYPMLPSDVDEAKEAKMAEHLRAREEALGSRSA